MHTPPPSDARNHVEAAGLCRVAQMGTGATATAAHRPLIGQGVRRRLSLSGSSCRPSEGETTVVDRHIHSRG